MNRITERTTDFRMGVALSIPMLRLRLVQGAEESTVCIKARQVQALSSFSNPIPSTLNLFLEPFRTVHTTFSI